MRVDIEQQTPEWHAWRAGGIGASDAATILGLNKYCTAHAMWLKRTNRVEKEEPNAAMLWGIKYEPDARYHYAKKTGVGMHPACYQHDDHPHIRVSLDGISYDGLHVTDFKVPQQHNWDNVLRTLSVPESWILQVQYQMMACGAQTGELSVFNVMENDSVEIPVKRDLSLETEMINASIYMWECIQNDMAPELTDLDLPYQVLVDEQEYNEINQRIEILKARKEEIREGWIKQANGKDFRSKFFTIKNNKQERVEWKRYAEELDEEGVHKQDFVKQLDIWTVRTIKRRK